jgi:hypothetical protein
MGSSVLRLCATSTVLILACRPPAPKVDPSSLEGAAAQPGLTLPQAPSFFGRDEAEVVVVLSRDQVLVAGDRFPVAKVPAYARLGLSADDKLDGSRDEYFITPLAHAVAGAPRPPPGSGNRALPTADGVPVAPPVVVAADERTPYRVLAEVISTAAKAKKDDVGLAAHGTKGVAVIPLDNRLAPLGFDNLVTDSPRHRLYEDAETGTVVIIRHDGFALQVAGHPVATGCEAAGGGIAVPNDASGARAYPSLRDCLARIRGAVVPDGGVMSGWISAEPDIDVGTLVATRDAIHHDANGKDLVEEIGLLKPVAAGGAK